MRPTPIPPPLEEITRRITMRRTDLECLGAQHLAIFGSCARGEQRHGSDVDLIVHLQSSFGYFDLGEMKELLENDLGEVNPISASGPSEARASAVGAVDVF